MAHVATITIDHTKVPGDLTDYVGLIVPDGSAGYSALYALCLEGGGDIRLFKSDDTTELAREIVTFSVTDETGEIHYKYSGTLSSSVDTDIHVYADGSSSDYAVGATYGRNAVWSAYGLVSHDGGGTDSTGNGNTGTGRGGITIGGATGKMGEATTFDGSNDGITIAHSASINVGALLDSYTISVWSKNNSGSTLQSLMSKFDAGASSNVDKLPFLHLFNWTTNGKLGTGYRGTNGTFRPIQNTATGLNDNSWVYSGFIHDGNLSQVKSFVNDDSFVTETRAVVGTTMENTSAITIGYLDNNGTLGQYFPGDIDEIRLIKIAISQDWKDAEYNNQNSYSTFYSVAAVGGGSAAQAARRGVIMMM